MVGKECKIQKTDMQNGLRVPIVLPAVQLIEGAAEVGQGAVGPIPLVEYLHFKVEERVVVQQDFDIQNKVLGVDGAAELHGISDVNGMHLVGAKVEQGADQADPDLWVFLKHCPEKVIVGKAVGNGSACILRQKNDRCVAT